MKRSLTLIAAMAGMALLFFGCAKKAAEETHDHSEHAAEGNDASVTFKEGRGLLLTPQIVKALGLTTIEATEQPLAPMSQFLGQVFTKSPATLAAVRTPLERAERMEKSRFSDATFVRIDRSTATASRMVDVVFSLQGKPDSAIGDFVTISSADAPVTVLAVPRSAVLESATGTFVYVVNGDAYLRAPVKLGISSAELVEIADGLYAGDRIVVSPVEQLWLSELRLTKGGGHSH